MDRLTTSRRLQRLIGALAGCALVALSAACAVPAWADQLEQHNELVNKFVTEMNANPLVADCAAHADFVVGTSSAFDHVEFPSSSFDSAHSSVIPWNDSFDQAKQKVKVDTIVTIEGLGVRKTPDSTPDTLKFRCGFSDSHMLAFSWNDPVAPLKAKSSGHGSTKAKKNARGKARATTRSSKRSKSSPARMAARSTATQTATR